MDVSTNVTVAYHPSVVSAPVNHSDLLVSPVPVSAIKTHATTVITAPPSDQQVSPVKKNAPSTALFPTEGSAFHSVSNSMAPPSAVKQSHDAPRPNGSLLSVAAPKQEVVTPEIAANFQQEGDSVRCAYFRSISETPVDNKVSSAGDSSGVVADSPESKQIRCFRRCRKRPLLDGQLHHCPVCGVSLRPADLVAHIELEIEKLAKLCKSSRKTSNDGESHCRKNHASQLETNTRYKVFQRVKLEREARLSARKRKRHQAGGTECPVCGDMIVGTTTELSDHVDKCLMQGEDSEDVVIVDSELEEEEEEEEFEEYTWAGQTRIRTSSMLHGGLGGSGFVVGSKCEDDGAELNIDEDETELYGKAQYQEADIIPCCSEEPSEEKARQALRDAVLRGGSNSTTLSADSNDNTNSSAQLPIAMETSPESSSDLTAMSVEYDERKTKQSFDTTAAMSRQIATHEDRQPELNNFKCLICMEPYKCPLTSIQCWHVHCEECWLKTLGAKKLCPQCNMITSAADLRKIFL